MSDNPFADIARRRRLQLPTPQKRQRLTTNKSLRVDASTIQQSHVPRVGMTLVPILAAVPDAHTVGRCSLTDNWSPVCAVVSHFAHSQKALSEKRLRNY